MRRRRLGAAAVVAVVAATVALGLTRPWRDDTPASATRPPAPSPAPAGAATTTAPAEPAPAPPPAATPATRRLPRGGTVILPRSRVVALFGAPQAPELGALGRGTPDEDAARLTRIAAGYRAGGRPVLPALWLIASISSDDPGADGLYRTVQPDATIRRYLAAARRARMLLVLDVQPGRAGILDEVRRLTPYLREPDVGLALDPEWALGPAGTPADGPGSIPAATVEAVAAELSRLVTRNRLPQKLLVVHRFAPELVPGADGITPPRGVALVFDANAIGPAEEKTAAYRAAASRRGGVFGGVKLFFEEDPALLTPAQVLALDPPPDVVVYE